MRDIKQLVTEARTGIGPFQMTSSEVVVTLGALRLELDHKDVIQALESARNGTTTFYERKVVLTEFIYES